MVPQKEQHHHQINDMRFSCFGFRVLILMLTQYHTVVAQWDISIN